MIEYYIRRLGKLSFEVSKFEETKAPTCVYNVDYSPLTNSGRCNCFAFFKVGQQDKHIEMVRDWLKAGSPIPLQFGGSN